MSLTSESSRFTNFKHPGAKRLMLEAQEMRNNTDDYYYCAQPVEDNLFEWHFTLRGPRDTEFEGGIYHGRLSFPTEYPMKPPSIYLLTPNGRFETNKKICLSISGHHPETWQPSWSIRTALLALMGFMPTETNHAIGSLNYSVGERRDLARKSRVWQCETCGLVESLLKKPNDAINDEIKSQLTNISDTTRLSSVETEAVHNNNSCAEEVQNLETNETCLRTSASIDSHQDDISDNPANTYSNNLNPAQNLDQPNNDTQAMSHGQTNQSIRVVNESSRSNSNYMLKSIFVLLLVLLFRRIFMMATVA